MTDKQDKWGLATRALHAGHKVDSDTLSRGVPIYATTSYMFKDTEHAADLFALKEFGNIYSRLMNPTCDVLEKRLAALDGGVGGLAFASGMAAITASIATIAKAGQNILAARSLYGGTVTLFTHTFSKMGIETRFFDSDEPEKITELADENTRCVYIETIGNPKNNVPDFDEIARLSHEAGLPLIVDNTVMTPVAFRPIEHGADIVVYSATKYIGGHGVHIGGAIVDSGNFRWADDPQRWPEFCSPDASYHGIVFAEAFKSVGNVAYILHARTHWLRDTGGCMSPYAAHLFLLGLETLQLRMERHMSNAAKIATWLDKHNAVEKVIYAGLESSPYHANAKKFFPAGHGAIVGFEIKGGKDAGIKFVNNVQLISHLANIGDAKTLVIHPASTTHQQLTESEQAQAGVTPSYIRLSVGIEDVEDIKADIDQALKACRA